MTHSPVGNTQAYQPFSSIKASIIILSLIITNGSGGAHGNLQIHQDQSLKDSPGPLLLVPRGGLGV